MGTVLEVLVLVPILGFALVMGSKAFPSPRVSPRYAALFSLIAPRRSMRRSVLRRIGKTVRFVAESLKLIVGPGPAEQYGEDSELERGSDYGYCVTHPPGARQHRDPPRY